jgi:hypothetical protein
MSSGGSASSRRTAGASAKPAPSPSSPLARLGLEPGSSPLGALHKGSNLDLACAGSGFCSSSPAGAAATRRTRWLTPR